MFVYMTEAVTVQQAFRYELAPSSAQEEFLSNCAGASRFWFNQGLALVKERLDQRAEGLDVDVPWSYKGLCVAFRGDEIKDALAPWRDEVVVGAYQAGLEALGNAFQNFSKGRAAGRKTGFPKFRAKGRSRESIIFQRPRIADSKHVLLDRRLGPIRSKESFRKLTKLLDNDPNARILRSTVSQSSNRWVISFTVERSMKHRQSRMPDAVVGVDLGLARLATLSTGEVFENNRPLQAALAGLKRSQRKLDRQRRANNPANYHGDGRVKPGPRSWHKSKRMLLTEQRIQRIHARVADLRREQAHQFTTTLTREFGVIGIENLSVSNMIRNRRLARHIADVGWGMIASQLEYKTSWSAGSILVTADRFYPSSKTCSQCGSVKAKLNLSERVFTCDAPECDHSIDRDLNAAINLAQLALRESLTVGRRTYVARAKQDTLNAHGGQISLIHQDQQRPMKCEGLSRPRQRGNALALATG